MYRDTRTIGYTLRAWEFDNTKPSSMSSELHQGLWVMLGAVMSAVERFESDGLLPRFFEANKAKSALAVWDAVLMADIALIDEIQAWWAAWNAFRAKSEEVATEEDFLLESAKADA